MASQVSERETGLILVTGATGRHGGTGAHVARRLLASGRPVRILARQKNDRTDAFERAGADVVIGDLRDRASLERALAGVSQATFTYPIAAGVVEAAANFAAAARRSTVPPRTVVMSMAVAHPESPSPLGRNQWLAEEVLTWGGLELCVLRIAALFFENIPTLHGISIRERGMIRNSFGSAQVPWISGRDAASLMVAALLAPEKFGSGIHYPPGVQLMDHSEIAQRVGEWIGREVRFEPISSVEWRDELIEVSACSVEGLISTEMAEHISAVGAALASGKGPIRAPNAQELERLTARVPERFENFLENSPAFAR